MGMQGACMHVWLHNFSHGPQFILPTASPLLNAPGWSLGKKGIMLQARPDSTCSQEVGHAQHGVSTTTHGLPPGMHASHRGMLGKHLVLLYI